MSDPGPVYEVTLSIDSDNVVDFDAWLEQHVAEMLELPGFVSADVFEIADDQDGRSKRVCHYYLGSQEDFDTYLSESADAMRQSGIDAFGDQMHASRRILHSSELGRLAEEPTEDCPNCGESLRGQYCANCGQRASSRLISILELVRDAFGDVFELDSRLWRTLIPLLTRPGRLTRDYLEGRRARYMPPFRTYLVLSILFFFASFFNPEDDFGILFEPPAETVNSPPATSEDREVSGSNPGADQVSVDEDPPVATQENAGLTVSMDSDSDDCDFSEFEDEELPEWLARRLTKERLENVCTAVIENEGRAFIDKMADNGPIALIVLLPLMALVQKILYPLSKRYYVEHLLFFVHYHAFFFLILTLQMSLAGLVKLTGLPLAIVNATATATTVYIFVYLYKAMRYVYGQGYLLTAFKFVSLSLAYFFGLASIFVVTAVIAAFSVAT